MTADPRAHDAHDLPLAERLVADAIRQWLDTATGLAQAANGNPPVNDYERGIAQGIVNMRYGHLDNYWYTVVPKILDELRRTATCRKRKEGRCD